jgi:hypothetical protein
MFGRQHSKLVSHFRASAEAGFVDLRWRATEASGVRFRLLRSERGYSGTSEATAASDALWEGTDTGYQDRGVAGQRRYYYVLFARGPAADWQEQGRARVKAKSSSVDRASIEGHNLEIGAYPIPPTGH